MTEAAVAAKALTPPPPNQLADTVQPSLPPQPNAKYIDMPDLMTKGTRKILVYIEFPMMAPLLISVLQLHNINPLVIHGGHGAEERNEIVLKFHSDPKARILIFSSVGAVGLNLTAASVVVLFVSCPLTTLTITQLYLRLTGSMLVAHARQSNHRTRLAAWPAKGGHRL